MLGVDLDPNKVRFAGDVNINNITIVGKGGNSLNITNLLVKIQVFEDMFSPFITGTIVLKDSLDLVNFFPFIGEEFLFLDITTPSFDTDDKKVIRDNFYIYKMSDREQIVENSVVYTLHFINLDVLKDLNTSLSQPFSGTGTEMIARVVGSYLGSSKPVATAEQTTNKTKFIACNWSPIKTINYICKNSQSGNRSDYVFFENKYGYNFTTLGNLMTSQPVYQEFKYTQKVRDISAGGQSYKDLNADYSRIRNYRLPVGFDYIDRVRNGALASKLITHDYVTKKYSAKNFAAPLVWSAFPHLNRFPPFTQNVPFNTSGVQIMEAKHWGIFAGEGDITNTKAIQTRLSLLKLAESFKFEMEVPGRTDYTVGMKVNVLIPSTEPSGGAETPLEQNVDKMFSGNYLISAINHSITRDSHTCVMELIKDSLVFNLDG